MMHPPYDIKPEFCEKCNERTLHNRKLTKWKVEWIVCSKCETKTIMEQNLPKKIEPDITISDAEIICDHQYEIAIQYGLGINMLKMASVAVDGAEITCYCEKCKTVFKKITLRSDGTIQKR